MWCPKDLATLLASNLEKRWQELGYADLIFSLKHVLGSEIWLAGGWVRSIGLGHFTYSGDIDVLVTLTADEIEAALTLAAISWSRTLAGAIRVALPDGNHIDISSAFEGFARGQIIDRMMAYDASVNAVALNLTTLRICAVTGALDDLSERRFRTLGPVGQSEYPSDLLFNVQSLRDFNRLTAGTDSRTQAVMREVEQRRSRLTRLGYQDALAAASTIVRRYIPPGKRAWIVRGYVRTALLGNIQLFDDIDITCEVSPFVLKQYLDGNSIRYVPNIFGTPKIRTETCTTIDIWPINGSLEEELQSYGFGCDSIAWNIDTQALVDPGNFLGEIKRRELTVKNSPPAPWPGSREYDSVKAAYICLRYGFRPTGEACRELLTRDCSGSGYLAAMVEKRARELACSCSSTEICDRFAEQTEPLRSSHAMELLRRALESAGRFKID